MPRDQQVFCQIRRDWIAATPEEVVRQRLLHDMVNELGYPSSLIAVEKALRQLPHLSGKNPKDIPDRRIDILCYAPASTGSLSPLLVVECKAVPLTWRVVNQVLGYNQLIQSPFVAIANEGEVRTAWFDGKEWSFISYLPYYQDLVNRQPHP